LGFADPEITSLGKGKMGYSIKKQMTCCQVRRLMDLYICNDPSLRVEKRKAFDAHLHNCWDCARKHEESQWIASLVRESWPYEEKNQAFLKRINQLDQRNEVIEQCWQELKCRIPELTPLEKERKYLPLFQRIGAFAACLIIGIFVFLVFSYLKPSITWGPAAECVVSGPKPSLKVELVSENGNMPLPYSHQITASKELKNLIINSKYWMVMNTKTSLSIEPLVENNRIGCKVTLDQGEIYINVEHDGKPFTVATAHGKAIITGTTFDVRTTDTTTTLVVTEGTVLFGSTKRAVEVAAGQTSEIVSNSTPTKPISCNTTKLTAWATAPKTQRALAQIKPPLETYGITGLPLFVTQEPIDLKSINYEQWVEQKRGWFKQQFPWIFQLKAALSKEGIEVDYPELLIKTGDVWQFVCFDAFPVRFSIIDPNSLIKTASGYGFEKQWLLENVPVAKSTLEKPILAENSMVGLKAFEQWLKYAKGEEEIPSPLFSYLAAKYLAETRSIIWFSLRDGKYGLTDEEQPEVLDLLQEEVRAACMCQNDVLCPDNERKGSSYCADKCQESDDNIVGYIKTMKVAEERRAEYEISE
jgi:hypothetical protein